ncbi:MAG: serine/threonine-protein kinase, partial [Gemmatimonadales bacterium]
HDPRQNRPIALKVLRPDLANALGPGRFLREITIAGRLNHPHILPLYDSGQAGDFLYFVMPFVAGETLRERLRREPQLPLDDVIAIARQVADALAFAHGHKVVHRDIKPENILLEDGQAYVADFGIAKAMVAAGDTLSSPGLAVGTPAYMSPEQAAGNTTLDGRSDLYSLGCVVYEMLAGEPPHTGPTAQVIIARQQTETPRSIRVVRPAVPEELERAVFKALAKSPADRFPTVSSFSDALEEAAGRRPASGRRSWIREAWLALAVVGVGGLAMLARHPAAPAATAAEADPNRVAVLYFDDLGDQGAAGSVAGGITEDLIDALGQVPALHVISPNGVRPFVGLHAPPDSIGRVLGVGTLVGGSVERSGNVLRVSVRLIDARTGVQLQSRSLQYSADDLFTLQDSLAQEVSRFLRQRLGQEVLLRQRRSGTGSVAAWERLQEGDASRETARTLRAQGDPTAAGRALDAADSFFERASVLDPVWPDPLVRRGWVASDRMEFAESAASDSLGVWYRQGIALADRALAGRAPRSPALELRGTLRYRYWLATGPDGASLEQAEQDLRRAAVPDNPSQARAWGTLSALLQATGQLGEANLVARRAYEADAYLAESAQLLFRLYHTSLDLG